MARSAIPQEVYDWKPIDDLPDNWPSISVPELSSLASVWAEQREQLKESQALREFNDRLIRQWSIETGIIERIFSINRG